MMSSGSRTVMNCVLVMVSFVKGGPTRCVWVLQGFRPLSYGALPSIRFRPVIVKMGYRRPCHQTRRLVAFGLAGAVVRPVVVLRHAFRLARPHRSPERLC